MSASLILGLIAISSIPAVSVYVWFRLAKYQFSYIRFFFALLAGAAAVFPALIMQDLLVIPVLSKGKFALFYNEFIRIAFTEEFSRLLLLFVFFWISSRITKDASEQPPPLSAVKKGAMTGLVAGFGFAILESAGYAASEFDIALLLLRTVTAAPLHAACGARVGMSAITFRSSPLKSIMRLFTAVIIHGVYNFLIFLPGISSIAAILIVLTAFASSIAFIRNNPDEEE